MQKPRVEYFTVDDGEFQVDVVLKNKYDQLAEENKALKIKLQAREINGTLRTYDGQLTAYGQHTGHPTDNRWREKYYDKVTELNISESRYDQLAEENKALKIKLQAREINGTLRTYDGQLTAYDELIKELVGALESLDQPLCERIIDPCGYNPNDETKESLVQSALALSEENTESLLVVRQALTKAKAAGYE